MKDRYLITGATGFVGSNLTRHLVNKGNNVSIIVRRGINWRLTDSASKITVYTADLVHSPLDAIIQSARPQFIVHMASHGVYPREDNPETMADINVKGTMRLLQAAKKVPFKRFINTGTAVEYGIKSKKMRENQVLNPINDYGVTKAAATLYCQKEGIRTGLPIVTLRLFTPFGYFEDKNRLIPSIMLSALANQLIRVSVPQSVRDFVFIDDVVRAYEKVITSSIPAGETINIGSGNQHSIKDVVDAIVSGSKSSSEVAWGSVAQQERYIEPERWEADIQKAQKLLGWKPAVPFKTAIRKTIAWFRSHQSLYA